MARVRALDLERHLRGAPVAPVYALVGDDDSLRALSLAALLDAAAPADQPGSTVRRFAGEPEARDVFDELRTIPFMGLEGRRVVVVEDGDTFVRAHSATVRRYVEKPAATAVLVLCMRKLGEPPEKAAADEADEAPSAAEQRLEELRAAVRTIRTHAEVVECSTPTWAAARQWVAEEARRRGLGVPRGVVYELVESLGPDLLALGNELGKLAAHAQPETTITERHLDAVGVTGRERSAYDLGAAIARHDAREALVLCGRLLERGDKLEAVIGVLARHLRRLWETARLRADGASAAQIAKRLDAPSFAVERDLKVVGALDDAWFARQLRLLAEADHELKTTSVRSGSEQVWLEGLVVRLCAG